ncbi:MAG: ABC transporter permease subunit [Oscillospiraceae bacterium]
MKSLRAFLKKEWLEQLRSGRLAILGILFVLFGIMNPAIAKLMPWLFEVMADTLEGSGLTLTAVTISAMDSWTQFFKNIPLALLAFILLESGVFTKEYQSGTLVLALTKGLDRYKVVLAKALTLLALWSAGYWLCFGITYGYNAYFWDNAAAQNLLFSALCWWLFGVWVAALTVLFSAGARSNTGVLAGTGAVVLAAYLIGMLPKAKGYMPTRLMDGNSLLFGLSGARDYTASLIVTAAFCVICLAASIPIFNKKQL